jgi:ketosteroid isomerase-like protein
MLVQHLTEKLMQPTSPKGDAACSSGAAVDDKAAMAAVLSQYNEALNASSVDRSLALYADDGRLHAAVQPVRRRQGRGARGVSEGLRCHHPAREIHHQGDRADVADLGVRSTNSAGTNKINATRAVSAEGNQELFIFRKGGDGAWKIAPTAFPRPVRRSRNAPTCAGRARSGGLRPTPHAINKHQL